MAVMDAAGRQAARVALTEEICTAREPIAIDRATLQAAVDAADAWVSSNAASFNSALPVAARNGLTTPQKARLLMWVTRQRYVTGA
jgi:hypothetical protein